MAGSGLSPRVRGNLRGSIVRRYYPRSIPASAGEPYESVISRRWTVVYPRECGGTRAYTAANRRFPGLSPRVRGNHRTRPLGQANHRSIPASAGEPSQCAVINRHHCGLSPRVRGNRPGPRRWGFSGWSIPASAGEPPSLMFAPGSARVYPRECGGTAVLVLKANAKGGLSPRVRGNQPSNLSRQQWRRSIPASAGEPWPHESDGCTVGVYPRECGGTPYCALHCNCPMGLSPRVRGNQ